jgi:excisionase family DNA binding protein
MEGMRAVSVIEHEPVVADEGERTALSSMEDVLENTHSVLKLVGPHGKEIELPPSIFHLLQQIVHHLLHGQAITIVPLNKELTTQQAADVLNVSRPYLIKVLEQGEIPFTMVGTHRRIRFSDLMEYKRRRDAKREESLAKLTRLSQELGLYD